MQPKLTLKETYLFIFSSKILKFSIAGFIGFLIDFSATYLIKELLMVNGYVASALGYSISGFANFMINRLWTFKQNKGSFLLQLCIFSQICLIAIILNTISIYLLVYYIKLNFYLGKACAIFITFLWNFNAHSLITFSSNIAKRN